ncbi:hypothetical protein vBBceHLY2_00080 [Bacillus phage vB_BceH_LY2]|nr:hypothetical protein vBBceHLY2_00080 [Bacillus phage vB_BceH_LY2]
METKRKGIEPKGAMEKAFETSERLEKQLFNNEKGEVKMTKAMLINGVTNEEVFVELNREGRVVVTKQDVGSTVMGKRYTVEKVVAQYTEEGWIDVTEQTKVHKGELSPLPELPTIPDEAIITEIKEVTGLDKAKADVDAYVQLNEQIKALTKEANAIKKDIRTYMDDNGLHQLPGNLDKEIYLATAKASNSSDEYTSYQLDLLAGVLTPKQLDAVTETRVSKTLVKKLVTDGGLSESQLKAVEKAEIYKLGTPKFTVRKAEVKK